MNVTKKIDRGDRLTVMFELKTTNNRLAIQIIMPKDLVSDRISVDCIILKANDKNTANILQQKI